MKFDYIFFDSGGTLYNFGAGARITPAAVSNQRIARSYALLGGMGFEVSQARFEELLLQLERELPRKLGHGYNYFALFKEVVAALDIAAGPEEAACLANAYAGPRYAEWLFPGTVAAIRRLHESGYRIGIIANTVWPGFTMDRAFDGVGLLPYFSLRLYSGDLAIAKPDPTIYHLAERLCGHRGKRLLYVGNDVKLDIEAAAAVGWSTAFRRSRPDASTNGVADLEFDHIDQLVEFCLTE